MAYLVICVELLELGICDKLAHLFVAQADAVVEVAQPNHRPVILYRAVLLESQSVTDGLVVSVPFFVICKARRQVSSHKADARAVDFHPYGDGAFITGHAGKSGLCSSAILQDAASRSHSSRAAHLLETALNIF